MSMRRQRPRLLPQRLENPWEDKREKIYGSPVQTTDRPDYFSIRSKLIHALILFSALPLFLAFILTGALFHSKVAFVIWAIYGVLCIAQNRFYMGVVFEFFPDGVYSHVPELISYNPFTSNYEMKGDTPGELRFKLRSVDRSRLHAVEDHTVCGWTFLLITLDDVRVGRLWWLSAICHPRRIMTLLVKQMDARMALPLLQDYILFPNA